MLTSSLRSRPIVVPLFVFLLALAGLALVTIAGPSPPPATARTTSTTAVRRAPAMTAATSTPRGATTPTTRVQAITTTRPTTAAPTTVSPSGADDGQSQTAAAPAQPALLVAGPVSPGSSSGSDLLLSSSNLWFVGGGFSILAFLTGWATLRYWRRTSPT